MKQFCLLVTTASLLLFCSQAANAQTTNRTDATMNDLLKEIRLLRQDLRQITTSAYRAHTMTERLRVQQGVVNRLTLDLSNLRLQLSSIKSSRSELTPKLMDLQRKVDSGVTRQSDADAVRNALVDLDRREGELLTRESQLETELTTEQGVLEDLTKKLDYIEHELLTLSRVDDEQPARRNQ